MIIYISLIFYLAFIFHSIHFTGEKFKEALKGCFRNGPTPTSQQSFQFKHSRSTVRNNNLRPHQNGNGNEIEMKRAQTLQDQHMILEIEWEE